MAKTSLLSVISLLLLGVVNTSGSSSTQSKAGTPMLMPRCGNDDKSLFASYPKWPASKSHLTYSFPSNTSALATRIINLALEKWADKTHFTFSHTRNYNMADLKISFHRMDHGDNHPFDGSGGVVTHAIGPTLHLDGDESWSGLVQDGSIDLETVALHGIGHLIVAVKSMYSI